MVGCFYGMSTIRLFYAKVSLRVIVSNYIEYKNVSSQSFQSGK